ncbi:hypothetical protein [Rhizobium sp. BR 314]|uniref:hypothetical protein n=1 Tax=Rhizobium sp. BR 314 TaxID=3040013 RepID=UPI0039BFBA8F
MAPRVCFPGEFFLDAIVVDPRRQLAAQDRPAEAQDWARVAAPDDRAMRRARERGPYIALRWVLNASLGIPLEPFTVWRRTALKRPPAKPIDNWHRIAPDTFWWDGLTEMLLIELDVNAPVTAYGLSRADNDPVATVSGGPGTITLRGGPMLGVRLSDESALTNARGLSAIVMADDGGWQEIQRVGLPVPAQLVNTSYYRADQQGYVNSYIDDPMAAAMQRLKDWGPVVGWPPLAGLDPWVPPDAAALVDQLGANIMTDLLQVLADHPPPDVDAQQLADAKPRLLPRFEQQIAGLKYEFGAGRAIDRSEMTTRPLQSLTTAVATDTWASLALGYGTGADVGEPSGRLRELDDFMVTVPWSGLIKVAVQAPSIWPFGDKPPQIISRQVDRELAAIVLAPTFRATPDTPNPLLPAPSFVEGAPKPDAPFTSSVKIETPRTSPQPGRGRASAYALARFDKPGAGQYRMRRRPGGDGWVPIGAAAPARAMGQPSDPALTPNTVMLRDSGVSRPITGAALSYQYAAAACDLFGQWSSWSTAWLALGPGDVQTPTVAVCRARASAPTGADPCALDASTEIVWEASERTLGRLHLIVDVFDPYPAPPAPLADPPDAPQPGAGVADAFIQFDSSGMVVLKPANVTVTPLHPDDTEVTNASPFVGTERRYRIEWPTLSIAYGAAKEKAVSIYAQAEETIRPGEWSGWGHAREMVIAPNPLPPPTPIPLPPEYPVWASLPDAAGLSYATIAWAPTGAWRYRVFEATEAAILAACGRPGPVLTQGLHSRMQTLFDLHKGNAHLPTIKAAYRKLGDEPILPLIHPDGTMRYEALLPRGSGLIHCFIVVGVSETNVVSGWPVPDADGRKGFLAYAIPRPLRLPMPEIRATIGATGSPEITVTAAGATPATQVTLYRGRNAVVARTLGTMERVAAVSPNPATWIATTFTDAAALRSWELLQYRAVVRPNDDLDKAGLAVDSPPSRSYGLLFPPAGPPALSLVEVAPRRSKTLAVVKVTSDAPRASAAIGDHLLSWMCRQGSAAPVAGSSTFGGLSSFPTLDGMLRSIEHAAYVGTNVFLRLDRTDGAPLALSVDVTDPLGRSTHGLLDLPPFVADPAPVISSFLLTRRQTILAPAVWIAMDTNAPEMLEPGHDWTLQVRVRPNNLLIPWTTRSFSVLGLLSVATESQVPSPAHTMDSMLARRLLGSGKFVLWIRASVAIAVGVTLTNSLGQSASQQGSTR